MKVIKFLVIAASILSSHFFLGTVSAADDIDSGNNSYTSTDSIGGSDMKASNGKFVTTDVIANPDKKATCTVPPQKKKPQPQPAIKPEHVTKSGAPTITNVCSPVININMPLKTSELYARSAHEDPQPDSISTTESQTNVVAPLRPTVPPDSFKFKVKDLVEADLSTHNSTLMWTLLAIFVVFAAIVTVGLRAAASSSLRSGVPWAIAVISIVLASFVAYWVIHSLATQGIEDTTIDRLYTELVTAQATPITSSTSDWSTLGQQLTTAQVESAKMQYQLSEQLNHIADMAESRSNGATWWQVPFLLLAGAATFYIFMTWHTRTLTQTPVPDEPIYSPLPLDDMYHLEDLLSKVAAITNKYGSTFDYPNIDLNELLQTLNRVRKLLESGLGAMDSSEAQSVRFILPDDSNYYFSLNYALQKLDEALSSRYELPRDKWRKNALKELAATRRVIVSFCNALPVGMDRNIK